LVKERTPKITIEEIAGRIKILKIFSIAKNKQVIGGRVEEGEVSVHDKVKIVRRGEVVGEGEIIELQKKKEKAGKVETGSECGIMINAKLPVASGDELHSFHLVTR